MNDASRAWLGLGGNIGDVEKAMAAALQRLDDDASIQVIQVSPVYKTPPWGVEDQPWFLNCCAEIATTLPPEHLLDVCQAAERAGKRERIQRWGPRTIDIDILVFEGIEQEEQRLTLPHPRICERAFVLVPLADIAPQVVLNGSTIAQLASECDQPGLEKTTAATHWWQAKG